MTEEEETYALTPKGADYARVAVQMFEQGQTHEQIADFLGLMAVQVLVAIADHVGALD